MYKANGYTNTCLHTSTYMQIHIYTQMPTHRHICTGNCIRQDFFCSWLNWACMMLKCMMLKSFKTSVLKSELSAGVLLIIKTVIHSILMGPLSFHEVIQTRKIDNLSIHKILNKTYSFVWLHSFKLASTGIPNDELATET